VKAKWDRQPVKDISAVGAEMVQEPRCHRLSRHVIGECKRAPPHGTKVLQLVNNFVLKVNYCLIVHTFGNQSGIPYNMYRMYMLF
jgi:hypothetical protein